MVDKISVSLNDEYGKVDEMTVRRGNTHYYLGKTLNFSENGTCNFDMEAYLDETLSRLPEDMNQVATTPTADHMFKTRNDAPKLKKERDELFHRVTAKRIFGTTWQT